MDAASWPSGAAAGMRVGEVDEEELDDDIEAPQPPAPPPGDPPPDAPMSTRAASSTGALPMSMSGPGMSLCYSVIPGCISILGRTSEHSAGTAFQCESGCWDGPSHEAHWLHNVSTIWLSNSAGPNQLIRWVP